MIYLFFLSCTEQSRIRDTYLEEEEITQNILLPWATESNISQDDQYVRFEMRAQRKVHKIPLNDEFDVGFEVEGYAYNDLTPSPVLIAKKGQTLKVDFFNDLDAPTTIHWHGIKSPESMDGVPYAHEPVGPEEFFNIEIPLEQEGTFWFHPHYDTARQVDMGLYGMLIVEDQEHPIAKYPKRFLLFDDWKPDQVSVDVEHSHLYEDGHWLVNQHHQPKIEVEEPTVFHVVNASNQGYLNMHWPNALWVGGEQGYWGTPAIFEHLLLAPGERAVLLDLGGEKDVVMQPYSNHGGTTWEEPFNLFSIEGDVFEQPSLPTIIEPPTPDPQSTDAVLVFQGNPYTNSWYINGAQFPDVEPIRWKYGHTGVLEVRNLSPTEHPFHLHGLVFEVLSVDGVPPEQRQIEDTVNVGIYQTVRLLITADNIGQWMAHCHILPHGDEGMMTIFEVYDEE